jgi:nascent polypeptide-associated complex subunit alpha
MLDKTGADPRDISLIVSQVGCSRAMTALKQNDGNLVNAIMSLTTN